MVREQDIPKAHMERASLFVDLFKWRARTTVWLARKGVANFDALRTVPLEALDAALGYLAGSRHAEAKRALGHALAWPELTNLG
jgi:hypothetical protein